MNGMEKDPAVQFADMMAKFMMPDVSRLAGLSEMKANPSITVDTASFTWHMELTPEEIKDQFGIDVNNQNGQSTKS